MNLAAASGRLAKKLGDRLSLVTRLAAWEIEARYRGSAFGIFWSLLNPLLMLAIYTWVFSAVFKARWSEGGTSTAEFSLIVFTGMIVHGLFAEVLVRAPTLISSNVNYVKKIVFPLDALPVIAHGSALFHFGISLLVLICFELTFLGAVPITVLWAPVVVLPFLVLVLGLAWFLASLGPFVRDITQALAAAMTALLFLSPILYPASALPENVQPYLFLNPLTFIIEELRDVVIWGWHPDLVGLSVYTAVAVLVAVAGHTWFQATRRGFADVL